MKASYKIEDELNDSITDLEFCFHNNNNQMLLAASSWDGFLRIWKVNQPISANLLLTHKEEKNAILRISFLPDQSFIFYGTTSGEVKSFNISEKKVEIIGKHKGLILGLKFDPQSGNLITAGSDCEVQFWDIHNKKSLKTIKLPSKPVFLDVANIYVACATVNSIIWIYDLKTQKSTEIKSNIIGTITSIALNPKGDCYIVGSTHGSVEVNFHLSTVREVFPCHRDDSKGFLYSSNRVMVTKDGKGAYSCGSNGEITLINLENGKKVFEKSIITQKNTQLTVISPSPFDIFAIAIGYDWSNGNTGNNNKFYEIHIKSYQ